jgi:hypothetical protein
MSKRTELKNNSEDCLTWNRSTRIRRAKSLQGCSKENLSPEKQQRKAPQTHVDVLYCFLSVKALIVFSLIG